MDDGLGGGGAAAVGGRVTAVRRRGADRSAGYQGPGRRGGVRRLSGSRGRWRQHGQVNVTTAGHGEHPALLTIAHGTRDPRGAREMAVLVEHLRARLGVAVANGWLEDFASPSAVEAAGSLVAQGATSVITLPLLCFGAYHAKTDVPAELAAVAARFPGLLSGHGSVLGLQSPLFELARRRIDAVSPREERAAEVLVVATSGSSDPDANGDLAKAARFLAEGTGHRWVEVAFAGVTWPGITEVLSRVAAAGARRAVIFSWSLLAGVLERRVREAAAQVDTGLEVRDAGRFGPDALLAEAIAARYGEVLHGDPRANCHLCLYRVPLPGLERRVGSPSAGGVAPPGSAR